MAETIKTLEEKLADLAKKIEKLEAELDELLYETTEEGGRIKWK